MIKGIIAGNFDVIHPGYIAMFEEMKQHCSCLIVLLHTDPSIERPHKIKPILHHEERKKILNSIKYVDDVIRYTYEEQLYDLLKVGEFDIRFLGDETEINLKTKNAEFIDWKWINPKLLPEVIVDFKKDLYLKLLKEIYLVID